MKKNKIRKIGVTVLSLLTATMIGTGSLEVYAYDYAKTGAYQDGTVTIQAIPAGNSVNGYYAVGGYQVDYIISKSDWFAFDSSNGSDFYIGNELSVDGGCHFVYKPDGTIWQQGALALGAMYDGEIVGSASPDANGNVSVSFQVSDLSQLPTYIGYAFQPAGSAYLHMTDSYGHNYHIWYYQYLRNTAVINGSVFDEKAPDLDLQAVPAGNTVTVNGKTWGTEAVVTATAVDHQSKPGGLRIYKEDALVKITGNNNNSDDLSTQYVAGTNGTYKSDAHDMLANMTERISLYVDFIDTEAPSIHEISTKNSNYCTSNVLTVNASDAGCGLAAEAYSWNDGNWTSNPSITITENGTYTVRVRDALGNESSKSISVTNIDRTIPTIHSFRRNGTGYCTSDVLTVEASDSGSGLATDAYSFNNGSWSSSNTFPISENGTYKVRVRDCVGNISEQSITVTQIDHTSPAISEFSEENKNWCLSSMLTVKATDNQSGLADKPYSFNGGDWTKSNRFTAIENGTYTVKVRDAVGNISEKTLKISNIDRVAPKMETDILNKGNEVNIEGEVWSKEKVIQTRCEDNGIGVSAIEIKDQEDQVIAKYEAVTLKAKLEHISDSLQSGQYKVISYDALNNKTETQITIQNVDSTPPLVQCEHEKGGKIIEIDAEEWSTEERIKVIASDPDTGIGKMTLLTLDGNAILDEDYENGEKEVGLVTEKIAPGSYLVQVRDLLGNETIVRTKVNCLDNQPPTIVRIDEENKADDLVRITIEAIDNEGGSGLHETAYSFDGGKTWQQDNYIDVARNGAIEIGVRDKLELITYRDVFVSSIEEKNDSGDDSEDDSNKDGDDSNGDSNKDSNGNHDGIGDGSDGKTDEAGDGSDGKTDEAGDGSDNGKLDGAGDGSDNGSDGAGDGTDGETDGAGDGTDGKTDGAGDGTDGGSDGAGDGMNGGSDGAGDGSDDGKSDGAGDGTDGGSDGAGDGSDDGKSDGAGDGTDGETDGAGDGTNGETDGAGDGTNGASGGAGDGSNGGSINGSNSGDDSDKQKLKNSKKIEENDKNEETENDESKEKEQLEQTEIKKIAEKYLNNILEIEEVEKDIKENDSADGQLQESKVVKTVAAAVLITLFLLGLIALSLYLLLNFLHYRCILYALDDKNKKIKMGYLTLKNSSDEWMVEVPDHMLGTVGTREYVLVFRTSFVKEEEDNHVIITIDGNRIREKIKYEIRLSI